MDVLGGLARVYHRGGGIEQVGSEEGLRLAREVVAHMPAIDPDDGNADALLAWFVFHDDFDFVKGAYHLQRALMARPGDADYLRYSMYQLLPARLYGRARRYRPVRRRQTPVVYAVSLLSGMHPEQLVAIDFKLSSIPCVH